MRVNFKSIAKELSLLAIFLSAALIVGLAERMIPLPIAVPGVKLGLSNVVILTALYLFDFKKSLTLVVLKCVMLLLLSGNFPAFLYSLSGSLLSFIVMWCLIKLPFSRKRLSPIGISAVGAVFHNVGQIAMAVLVLGSLNIAVYLPILIVTGVITGVLIGIAVRAVLPLVAKVVSATCYIDANPKSHN